MAGFLRFPILHSQDPYAVNFFFDRMAIEENGVFQFDVSMYSRGTELLAYMDPHNLLSFGVTQWDDLPVNRGAPSFDEPYSTEIFNTYFWPMICHTNMRRFISPDSRPVEHQGFLALFLDEAGMGLQDDGWMSFLKPSINPAGLDPRPTVDCYQHEPVADTFRPGVHGAPAGGLGTNADRNTMDGRVVFSFTYDRNFHAWFSQVCMASLTDFVLKRFNMQAHEFVDAAVGGYSPGPGNQRIPPRHPMGFGGPHAGSPGPQTVVIKREEPAITAEDHRNAEAQGHMAPHRARDSLTDRDALVILDSSVRAKRAGGPLGAGPARMHQFFVDCHYETDQAHSELFKTLMQGTWMGSSDAAQEVQEIRLVYKQSGFELFPVKANERTLANKVPLILESFMKGRYKHFADDTLDIIREMKQSTPTQEASPSPILEWSGIITLIDAARKLQTWLMWPQHPSTPSGAMDPRLPSFSELLKEKLSNLREFHRIEKYQEMSEELVKPILGRVANLIGGPNGWMSQKEAAYLPCIADQLYYSTADSLLEATHLPIQVKLFVKDTQRDFLQFKQKYSKENSVHSALIQQQAALSQLQGAQIQALQRQVKLSGTPPKGGLKGTGKQGTELKGTKRGAAAAEDLDKLMAALDDIPDVGYQGTKKKAKRKSGLLELEDKAPQPNAPSPFPKPFRNEYYNILRTQQYWLDDKSAPRCHSHDVSKVAGYSAWAAKCDCDIRSSQVHSGESFSHKKTGNPCTQPEPPLAELKKLLIKHSWPTKPAA
jgi:hypothetical protein